MKEGLQGHVIRGDNILNWIELLFRLNQEIPAIKIQISNKYQWSKPQSPNQTIRAQNTR